MHYIIQPKRGYVRMLFGSIDSAIDYARKELCLKDFRILQLPKGCTDITRAGCIGH